VALSAVVDTTKARIWNRGTLCATGSDLLHGFMTGRTFGHAQGRLRLTSRELRGQLIVLAAVLWGVAIVNASTSTPYLRSGQIKAEIWCSSTRGPGWLGAVGSPLR
jgi:hypothetical protein